MARAHVPLANATRGLVNSMHQSCSRVIRLKLGAGAMGRRRKAVRDPTLETKVLESGEKFVLSAGVNERDAVRLLATDHWQDWFQPRAAWSVKDWKRLSIQFCTVIMTTSKDVAGMSGALGWMRANCKSHLIHTFEGHRLIEAALRRHIHTVGDAVAEALLADNRVGPWSGRVWSCLLRYGKHSEVGAKCAAALAARAQTIWEKEPNASGMYALQALVECNYDAAAQVVALWSREDALRKLVEKRPCYMTLLLACLRCPRPERRQLVATFLLLFEDVNVCCVVLKALVRVKKIGVQILCEIAQHSIELNVWFSDYFQAFLENLGNRRPEVLPTTRLAPPTLESVQVFLSRSRVLHAPRAIHAASGLARNGNSALALHCRLLKVQYERKHAPAWDTAAELECETPPELWAATPEEFFSEVGSWHAARRHFLA